jgi:hypothetical protein
MPGNLALVEGQPVQPKVRALEAEYDRQMRVLLDTAWDLMRARLAADVEARLDAMTTKP